MANEQTSRVELEATSVRFVGLLAEGLPYIDAWTPTVINCGGCGVFANLLTSQLEKLEMTYKAVLEFIQWYNENKKS